MNIAPNTRMRIQFLGGGPLLCAVGSHHMSKVAVGVTVAPHVTALPPHFYSIDQIRIISRSAHWTTTVIDSNIAATAVATWFASSVLLLRLRPRCPSPLQLNTRCASFTCFVYSTLEYHIYVCIPFRIIAVLRVSG